MYTFLRLLFANQQLDLTIKKKFLRAMQTFDAEAVKDLDDILDSQGGFTQ